MNDVAKTILVMDDSEIVLELVRSELEAAGYEVRAARNLTELEEQSKRADSLDLVLMDVQMPELFGYDVAIVLRENYQLRCPIYLLSSLDEQELAEHAKESGLDGYISKRGGMEAIINRVEQLLGARS